MERDAEEQRKKQELKEIKQELQKRIANLKSEVSLGRKYLIKDLKNTANEIEKISKRYQFIAENLGIPYSRAYNNDISKEIQKIEENILEKTEEEKQKEESKEEPEDTQEALVKQIEELRSRITYFLKQKAEVKSIEEYIKEMPQYVEKHRLESVAEINQNLNSKVQTILSKVRLDVLQGKKKKIEKERGSILQKWLYGSSLKDEKLNNINAKIELEEKRAKELKPQHTISDMLEDIYSYSEIYNNGYFTEEMQTMVDLIKDNFDDLPSEKELNTIAKQNARANSKKNYPIVQGKNRLSKKEQIEYYKMDTRQKQLEIQNMSERKQRKISEEVKATAIGNFEGSVRKIKEITDLEDSGPKREQNERQDI